MHAARSAVSVPLVASALIASGRVASARSPFQSRGLRCPEGGSDRPPEGCAWREGGLGDQSVSVAHALVVRTESPTAAALHLRIAANACAGPVPPHTIEIVPRPAAPDESRGTLAGRRRQTSFAWSAGRPRMTHGTRLDCPSLACNASTRVSRSRRVLVVTHRGGCLRVALLALDDVSPRSVSGCARASCLRRRRVSDRTSVLAGWRRTLPSQGRTRATGRIAGRRAPRP